MKTVFKGAVAQLKVELRAAEKGIILSRPCIDARYDYILDDGQKLERIQVKYGDGASLRSSNAVVVSLRGWERGLIKRTYCATEVDALLVYIPKLNKVLKFDAPMFCGKTSITVRLSACKNGQVKGVFFAENYLW